LSTQNVLEVRRAIFVGGRTDRDKLEQAVVHSLLHIRCELEAASLNVAFDVVIEARFIDGYLTLVQPSDLVLVDVVAHDVVAHFGHAGACDEADVAGAEYS
jgi:hypothetical protein